MSYFQPGECHIYLQGRKLKETEREGRVRPEAGARKQWWRGGDSSWGRGQGDGSLSTGEAAGLEGSGGLEGRLQDSRGAVGSR